MAETKMLDLGAAGGRGNKLPPAGTVPPTRELPSANQGMVWRQDPLTGRWVLVRADIVRGPYLTKS